VKLDIVPNKGIGPIRFGMSRAEVRKFAPGVVSPFLKGPSAKLETDDLGEGIHVYYGAGYICVAVEVGSPSQVFLDGAAILGQPFSVARVALTVHDPNPTIDDVGAESRLIGVGLYCPDLCDGATSPVEGVIVFEPGYYDS
jgi:hypothetical protein